MPEGRHAGIRVRIVVPVVDVETLRIAPHVDEVAMSRPKCARPLLGSLRIEQFSLRCIGYGSTPHLLSPIALTKFLRNKRCGDLHQSRARTSFSLRSSLSTRRIPNKFPPSGYRNERHSRAEAVASPSMSKMPGNCITKNRRLP